jgi:hypothetical protein
LKCIGGLLLLAVLLLLLLPAFEAPAADCAAKRSTHFGIASPLPAAAAVALLPISCAAILGGDCCGSTLLLKSGKPVKLLLSSSMSSLLRA